MSITRKHDAINTPVLSLKTGDCSVCCSAGEYTPALRLSAGIATPCWHCQPLRLSGDGPGRCQALSCESEGQGQRVSTVSRIYIPFIPCHTGRRTESMQNSPASQASKPGDMPSTTLCPRVVATVQHNERGMDVRGPSASARLRHQGLCW